VPARCGAGRRRWLPGQVYGRYTAGTSKDKGIGIVAGLPGRGGAADPARVASSVVEAVTRAMSLLRPAEAGRAGHG
jgi:hypothetical protein